MEGKGEAKFALDPDGNLWIWEHRIAGLTGLVFYYYLVTGFLIGLGRFCRLKLNTGSEKNVA